MDATRQSIDRRGGDDNVHNSSSDRPDDNGLYRNLDHDHDHDHDSRDDIDDNGSSGSAGTCACDDTAPATRR